MQGLNPWLTTYLPAITTTVVAIATVVLVGLTYRYVRLTGRLVDESQRLREPSVVVDFEVPDGALRLVVENHGLSVAKNIRVTVLKDVQWLKQPKNSAGLRSCAPIKEGVSYLIPSRKLRYYLGYPDWSAVSDDQTETSLQIAYENEGGKKYKHVFDFDFRQLRDVHPESFRDSHLGLAQTMQESERRRWRQESSERVLNAWDTGGKKRCPMCAELIPSRAKKCPHCHEFLDNSNLKAT